MTLAGALGEAGCSDGRPRFKSCSKYKSSGYCGIARTSRRRNWGADAKANCQKTCGQCSGGQRKVESGAASSMAKAAKSGANTTVTTGSPTVSAASTSSSDVSQGGWGRRRRSKKAREAKAAKKAKEAAEKAYVAAAKKAWCHNGGSCCPPPGTPRAHWIRAFSTAQVGKYSDGTSTGKKKRHILHFAVNTRGGKYVTKNGKRRWVNNKWKVPISAHWGNARSAVGQKEGEKREDQSPWGPRLWRQRPY